MVLGCWLTVHQVDHDRGGLDGCLHWDQDLQLDQDPMQTVQGRDLDRAGREADTKGLDVDSEQVPPSAGVKLEVSGLFT